MTADTTISSDCLNIGLIRRRLSSEIIGHRICLLWDVTSTNNVLRAMAETGAPSGTVVLAESQHSGRAREGRVWFSPPGVNLYASVLFRPEIPLGAVPVFSFIASLAASDAIRVEGLPAVIKWPNDILVGRRKVAGTLVECSAPGGVIEYVIIGIGVNLNVDAKALRAGLGDTARMATSLRELTGREIDRNAFAGTLLTCLDRWWHLYTTQGAEPILDAWRERDILTGRRVGALLDREFGPALPYGYFHLKLLVMFVTGWGV
jgi:BirA family biotin operon repressor/biotin-[acetyl-CoA-carboxylase] ligase